LDLSLVSLLVDCQQSNQNLALKIPDLNAGLSGGTEPVSNGAEAQGVDGGTSFKCVELLALSKIPQVGSTLSSTRSTQRTIRRDGHSVNVTIVTFEIGDELAVRKTPDLDCFVPASRDDQRIGNVGGEFNATWPEAVTVLVNHAFALTKSVPKTKGSVSGS